MTKIKGITVVLLESIKTGTDPFGAPIFAERETCIENVLVRPNSTDDKINSLNLTGEQAEYTLAIPKNDDHTWEDRRVRFFGRTWKVVGIPLEGIDDLIPLDWNRKIWVALDEHAI